MFLPHSAFVLSQSVGDKISSRRLPQLPTPDDMDVYMYVLPKAQQGIYMSIDQRAQARRGSRGGSCGRRLSVSVESLPLYT